MKVLSLGDTHCGHLGGLTPPAFQLSVHDSAPERRRIIAEAQREMYKWYVDTVVKRGPYDVVILGGDLADGKQAKSDGEDLWSTKVRDQVSCAITLLEPLIVKGKTKVFGVKGSRYHTEGYADDEILEALGAEASHQELLEIDGTVFDIRHKVGCGGAPSSRPGVRNEWLHSLIWNAHGDGPRAEVVVRHHAHTYWHEGDGSYLGIVVPGLQWFSDFGQLNVRRWIGVGCVRFTTQRKGLPKWEPMLARLKTLAVKPRTI